MSGLLATAPLHVALHCEGRVTNAEGVSSADRTASHQPPLAALALPNEQTHVRGLSHKDPSKDAVPER
jgi:hypothetical protein